MENIRIYRNGYELEYKKFIFPAGEPSVRLSTNKTGFTTKVNFWEPGKAITISARLQNSDDVIILMLIVDALRAVDDSPIELFLPYFPGGRQDRRCNSGEAFSAKVYANIINNLNFKSVTIVDPHSEVSPALINNVKVISQKDVINNNIDFIKHIGKSGSILVAPDSGSNKKTAEIAKFFSHEKFIRADKLRNLQTGEIIETIVYCDDLQGRNVCIVDDICEGGRTFIELAKVLKSKNCGTITLYVTFGIFSKGLDVIYEGGIDQIYTTNAYRTDLVPSEKLNVLDLDKAFRINV